MPETKMGEILPIPPPKREPITEVDYRKVKPPPRFVLPDSTKSLPELTRPTMHIRKPVTSGPVT